VNTIWVLTAVVQWIVLILLVLIVAGILRYLGRVEGVMRSLRPGASKYEVGDKVADFEGVDHAANLVTLGDFLASGRETVLVFTSAECQACRLIQEQVAELASLPGGVQATGRSLAMFVSGADDVIDSVLSENPALLQGGVSVVLDREGVIFTEYGIHAVPTGLAIDTGGKVISQSMNPHVDWLYEVLGVSRPADSLLPRGARVPLVTLGGQR
jgi:AhpC/TSA family